MIRRCQALLVTLLLAALVACGSATTSATLSAPTATAAAREPDAPSAGTPSAAPLPRPTPAPSAVPATTLPPTATRPAVAASPADPTATAIPQPTGTIPPGWLVYRGPVAFPVVFAYPPDWEVDDGLFPGTYALFLYGPNGRADNLAIEIYGRGQDPEANIDVLRDQFFYKKTEYCDKTGIERTSYRRISAAQFAILGATCNARTSLGFILVASGLKDGDSWSIDSASPTRARTRSSRTSSTLCSPV
jgi:hypothetical protein